MNEKALAHYRKTPGFLQLKEAELLYQTAAASNSYGCAVEVGSLFGKSAGVIASAITSNLYCVDLWDDHFLADDCHGFGKYMDPPYQKLQGTFAETFFRNTASFLNIKALAGKSVDMLPKVKLPVGLLFLDGDHSFDTVVKEIETGLKKLKPRYLALHDYGDPAHAGVKAAADVHGLGEPKVRAGNLAIWILGV
jgi:hypothetical protein